MYKAVSICAKDGSKPPLPKNSQENSDILDYFLDQRAKAKAKTTRYISTLFVLDLNDENLEGTFVSSTGYKPGYTNWYGTEPDNDMFNQDYVAMHTDGTWKDYQYFTSISIICQQECQIKTTPAASITTQTKGKKTFFVSIFILFVILNFKKLVPANLVTQQLSLTARNDVSNSTKAYLSYRKLFQYAPKTGQNYHFRRIPKKPRISYFFSKPNRRFQLKTEYTQ